MSGDSSTPDPNGDRWARFQEVVLADGALRAELLSCTEDEAFVLHCVQLACERVVDLGADDVRAALAVGDRRWIERWL